MTGRRDFFRPFPGLCRLLGRFSGFFGGAVGCFLRQPQGAQPRGLFGRGGTLLLDFGPDGGFALLGHREMLLCALVSGFAVAA